MMHQVMPTTRMRHIINIKRNNLKKTLDGMGLNKEKENLGPTVLETQQSIKWLFKEHGNRLAIVLYLLKNILKKTDSN